jgi:nitroimidazol reductase NimA-like FMN-containing flavoprotein (pyridoxamine 5'-phosphate oxidase superfamily)
MPRSPDGARTTVRRLAEKQRHNRAELDAVLDAGRVAHVAVVDDGQPFVLPLAYARDGDRLLLHGSTGSRLFRSLAAGAPTCATVTLYDGLVLARSAFESSMHYRCAMVLGGCRPLAASEKPAALQRLTEGLLTGRWAEVRPASVKELAATSVLELPLDEWSVKVSDSPPEDPPEDVELPIWAGTLPIRASYGEPVAAPDLPPGIPLAASVMGALSPQRRGELR